MTCRRCGSPTPRLTVDQRYCALCVVELAPQAPPTTAAAWTPEWRRRGTVKDLTGAPR